MAEAALKTATLIAGRYELETPIGKGGMGEVWRAKHLALNSHVAIKFLHGASAQNESARRRFTTEAQVTAQLKTRHAVQVFDFGVTEDGHPFLVMELLEGETLGHRIERCGRLDVIETVRILGQSARALSRAHALGIVHRDFKPDNVVLSPDEDGTDYVKVLDFGLAKLVGILDAEGESEAPPSGGAGPVSTFTKTGTVLGTPYYMAPEQVRDASEVDLRADIWAFGVVAFECLTGTPPFTGKNLAELFVRVQRGEHRRAGEIEPSLPRTFDEWFDTACAPEPSARFADANVAVKKLLAALDCGNLDLNPSAARGRPRAASHDRPAVVVESGDDAVQPNAQTIEAAPKGVQPRSRAELGESAQFRKMTLSATAAGPSGLSDATMSHSIVEVRTSAPPPPPYRGPRSSGEQPATPRRARSRSAGLLLVSAIVVGAAIVAVRASAPGKPATIERPLAGEPVTSAAIPPAPPAAPTPPRLEPPAPAAVPAPSAIAATASQDPPRRVGVPPGRSAAPSRPAVRPTAPAPRPVAAATNAASPSPAPEPPPPPKLDPADYR